MEISTLLESYPLINNVGTSFLKFAESFKLYGEYANAFQSSMDVLGSCESTNKPFNSFLEKQTELSNLPLSTLLSLPINHVNTYKMLIEDICVNTPPNLPGYPDLVNAVSVFSATTEFVANRLAGSKNRAEIDFVARKISQPKDFVLKASDLTFVDKQECTIEDCLDPKKSKFSSLLVLFSESLLILRVKKTSYSVKEMRQLEDLRVDTSTVSDPPSTNKLFSINLFFQNTQLYSFLFTDVYKRNNFFEQVQSAISGCLKDRIYGREISELWERKDTIEFIPQLIRSIVEHISSDEKRNCIHSFFSPNMI